MNTALTPLNDRRSSAAVESDTLLERVRNLGHALASRRHDRPWLSLVAVPLAMTGAAVSLQLWLVPFLVLMAWWYAPSDTAIVTLTSVTEACVGAQWAFLGIYLMLALPAAVWVADVVWITWALVLFALGGYNRRKMNKPYGW